MVEIGSVVTALAPMASGAIKIGHSMEKKRQKRKKSRNLFHKLCCFGHLPSKSIDEGTDHLEIDYGFEDRNLKLNIVCCSRTWSNSCRELENYHMFLK